jgi:hypothetical protein
MTKKKNRLKINAVFYSRYTTHSKPKDLPNRPLKRPNQTTRFRTAHTNTIEVRTPKEVGAIPLTNFKPENTQSTVTIPTFEIVLTLSLNDLLHSLPSHIHITPQIPVYLQFPFHNPLYSLSKQTISRHQHHFLLLTLSSLRKALWNSNRNSHIHTHHSINRKLCTPKNDHHTPLLEAARPAQT